MFQQGGSQLRRAMAQPAARLMAALWVLSAAYLAWTGNGVSVVLVTVWVSVSLVLALLTVRITIPTPDHTADVALRRGFVWAQLAVAGAVIALTGLDALGISTLGDALGWSRLVAWLRGLGESLFSVAWVGGPGNAVANPVQYFVIPFGLLLLLGARPRDVGLGRGRHVWRVCGLWLILPVAVWAVLLVMGVTSLAMIGRRLLSNALQNGFFEEFLFRGVLQTRLNLLMPGGWALVVQALLFGLWHLGANTRMMEGNLWAGLALCVISQGVVGIAYGIVFRRTGNLVAPSVAHVVMNALGQTFG
ncbi:MAG: CPBP family intramembrane metalloprotease [Caldilineaceae bacterium]|nr:CPBP family intramembrane metalloprotease [Caldilineaceae bacterium]